MRMKFMLAAVLIAAACRGGYKEEAQATPAPGAAPAGGYPATSLATPAPGPSFVAHVVTIDAAAPSITLRETAAMPAEPAVKTTAPELKPGDRTIRVEGTAVTTVSTLKAGDQVRVSCREYMAMPETTAAPTGTGTGAGAGIGTGATGTGTPGTGTGTATTGVGATGTIPMASTDLGRCESIVAMALVTGAATGR